MSGLPALLSCATRGGLLRALRCVHASMHDAAAASLALAADLPVAWQAAEQRRSLTATSWSASTPNTARFFSTAGADAVGDASASAAAQKLHLLKCKKAPHTPVSQAVALLLSRETVGLDKLQADLATLTTPFRAELSRWADSEAAAFLEVCRQLGVVPQGLFADVAAQWGPRLGSVHPEDLSAILWAISRLMAAPPGLAEAAAHAAANAAPNMTHQDLAVTCRALADLKVGEPFSLIAVQDAVLSRRDEFSSDELVDVCSAFADMKLRYYDKRLIDALVDELLSRGVEAGGLKQLLRLRDVLDGMQHVHKPLAAALGSH